MTLPFRPEISKFLLSAPRWDLAEQSPYPQVAIGGRSNVGKSSLLNSLLRQRSMARTSGRPGRTQALNLFLVDETLVLVDLPGHGFAAAPTAIVREWGETTRRYLERSTRLAGAVLLLDVRRDPSAEDDEFARTVLESGRPLLPVITKADKLGRGAGEQRRQAIAAHFGLSPQAIVMTSAKSGMGRDALWENIWVMVSEFGEAEE